MCQVKGKRQDGISICGDSDWTGNNEVVEETKFPQIRILLEYVLTPEKMGIVL